MSSGNPRKYGKSPYNVVLVHGGPGAQGEMKPVAKRLSGNFGVLEPLQTKDTVDGQVEELKNQIEANTKSPIFLVGYSWGAWLAFILAAKYPKLVKKLILVSSGPFIAEYAKDIMSTRISRLNSEDNKKLKYLMQIIQNGEGSNATYKKFGEILSKADAFSPIKSDNGTTDVQIDIYQKVWPEGDKLRKEGKLLMLGILIKCPVIVIHGNYDPHPFEGVIKPLSKVLNSVKFILLKNCGHTPWREKDAKRKFYSALKKALR